MWQNTFLLFAVDPEGNFKEVAVIIISNGGKIISIADDCFRHISSKDAKHLQMQ